MVAPEAELLGLWGGCHNGGSRSGRIKLPGATRTHEHGEKHDGKADGENRNLRLRECADDGGGQDGQGGENGQFNNAGQNETSFHDRSPKQNNKALCSPAWTCGAPTGESGT